MKKLIILILTLAMCTTVSSCGKDEAAARAVLENYISIISDGNYDKAYVLLSDYDKSRSDEELFTEWRTVVSKIQTISKFSCKKINRFKDKLVLGTVYEKAFGFEVTQESTKTMPEIKMVTYDQDTYKIMVIYEEGKWKVALFLNDLKSVIEGYNEQMGIKNS